MIAVECHNFSDDVLERLVRTSDKSKVQVQRELGCEIVAEARAELESAVARQLDLLMWVQQVMSEAGWKQYRRLHSGAVPVSQTARELGGVTVLCQSPESNILVSLYSLQSVI